jgi:hypothetical protein
MAHIPVELHSTRRVLQRARRMWSAGAIRSFGTAMPGAAGLRPAASACREVRVTPASVSGLSWPQVNLEQKRGR